VIPPGGIVMPPIHIDGKPTPPIYYPPQVWPGPGVPGHPIELPPDSPAPPVVWPSPGVPAHPIALPPEGVVMPPIYIDGKPTPPIYYPGDGSPAHPIAPGGEVPTQPIQPTPAPKPGTPPVSGAKPTPGH
jgi:hypothetical protein